MKHLIVLVGLPGSGKSSFCHNWLERTYTRINQDEQGKQGHKDLFFEAMHLEKPIIIDRCNFNKQQRARYLVPAKELGYKTTIILFRADAKTCIERIKNREHHPNLSNKADNIADVVNMFDKMMVIPDTSEADEVLYI